MKDVADQELAERDLKEQNSAGREQTDHLVFDYALDAPPEKVWRALSIAEFRERWLPKAALADGEPVGSVPGEAIGYRMRDDEPPFLESVVTFHVKPNADGGTDLRIIHRLSVPRCRLELPTPANSNGRCLMRAA